MASDSVERNYAFFKANLDEYLKDPLKNGKYGVFYDEELKNTFDTFEAAIRYAVNNFPFGFAVQQIVDTSKIINYLSSAVI